LLLALKATKAGCNETLTLHIEKGVYSDFQE